MVQELEKRTRIDVADVLRGLAVMGIIVLHSIEHFNFYSFPDTSTQSAWLNFSDKAIWDGLFSCSEERLMLCLPCFLGLVSLFRIIISVCVAMIFVCVSAGD